MGKYREDAQELLRLVGGKDNIVAVTHCITRMRFALADPHIGTVICGSGNPAHIRANVRAAEKGPLPASIYIEAKRRLDALG